MTKILLVEDDKSLREIYGVRLLAEGYDIVSAGDGEEALAMAIKEKPNLIVSDVMMPKISGFDMLDILRSTTETRDIKVIMMTALSSDDQRTRGEQLGADRYLVKSQVGIEDVVRTVHEVLGDSSAAPATAGTLTAAAAPASDDSLPQPTAPFTSDRPATLGVDVVATENNPEASEELKTQIEQELQAQAEKVTASQVDEVSSESDSAEPAPSKFKQPDVVITEHPTITPIHGSAATGTETPQPAAAGQSEAPVQAAPQLTPAAVSEQDQATAPTPVADDASTADADDSIAPLPPQPTISK